ATGSDVGGLVGRAEAGATITWTYAVVSVQGGASNIGGLVGVAHA
ncbi:GLUG motif-containing protein, partial [Lactococcus petauri]